MLDIERDAKMYIIYLTRFKFFLELDENKIAWSTYRGKTHEKLIVEGTRRSCETKHELYALKDYNLK